MLCERCKQRPASVHYTEVVNNRTTHMHLCEVCAWEAQKAFGMGTPLNLHSFLVGLMSPVIGAQESGKDAGTDRGLSCMTCGLAEEAFVKQGLLGCADCYRHFGERLEPLLRRIHGSTRHTGKVPQRSRQKYRLVQEVERLKAELSAAVEREEFERAAELRDEIKKLEQGLT
jgi:protein arginine kinase activator